jgi:hypothetical protein
MLNNQIIIQVHFVSRQMKFLRMQFPDTDKKELWKKLNKENGDGKAANSTHVVYLPDNLKGPVQVELKSNPFQFLESMFEMSQFLESKENVKTFALLPLRHGFIPRSIRITTCDFAGLVRKAGLKVPKKKTSILTDDDIFIGYKHNKV